MLRIMFVLTLAVGLSLTAQASQAVRTAEIIEVLGDADVVPAEGERQSAEVGMILSEGDIIETGAGSWLMLYLGGIETSTVEMEENTTILLSELFMDAEKEVQKTMLDLAIGRILITAEKIQKEDSNFQVKTPTSVVGVRGTTFAVEVESID